MAITGIAPIKHALVRYLRTNAALKAALPGGIHEGFAPPSTKYPFLTYQVHYAPSRYTWTSVTLEVGFDVFVWTVDSVEADNLDALVLSTLHDADLVVDGQSTLICRRVSSLSLPDTDGEGKKIYQVGGIYEIWADQPLPSTKTSSFSAAAELA